jgi:hypothetical protein
MWMRPSRPTHGKEAYGAIPPDFGGNFVVPCFDYNTHAIDVASMEAIYMFAIQETHEAGWMSTVDGWVKLHGCGVSYTRS